MLLRHMAVTALFLGLFAVIGTGLVAVTFINTEERIAQNELDALMRSLHTLVPPSLHDNEMHEDTITVVSHDLLGTGRPVTVYRAKKDGRTVATILTPIAPDGYNGDIKLLVAIRENGTLLGVRVIAHRETPGLGDGIDEDRSDWIRAFKGKSLDNPGGLGWRVVKDGGEFDQFTGATITPRAVVKAVHNALTYFKLNRSTLLGSKTETKADSDDN